MSCKQICPDNKICNPSSRRCVLKRGLIGKRLLKSRNRTKSKSKSKSKNGLRSRLKIVRKSIEKQYKKITKQKSKSKSRNRDKILNPATNRYVLKTGKIGKKLLENKLKIYKDRNKIDNKVSVPFKNVLQHYDRLLGPIRLTEYINYKLHKHIYSIGERHDDNIKCPNEPNKIGIESVLYIKELLKYYEYKEPNKIFDIFAESPTLGKELMTVKKSMHQSQLSKFINIFDSCLKIEKIFCEFKNVRVHYMDIRKTIKLRYTLIDQFLAVENLLYGSYDDAYQYWNRVPKEYVNQLLNFNDFKLEKLPKRITKQLDFIPHYHIKKLIIDDYNERLKNIKFLLYHIRFLDKIFSKDTNPEKNPEKFLPRHVLVNIHKMYLDLSSSVMDLYLLGRIFRTFKNTDGTITEPENIIILSGNYHNDHYDEVFKMANFDVIYNVYNNNECLDIELQKQPWFS